ncbi:MAG: hypothetical protein ACOYN6_00395 [Ignavibacteria bacterium]
MKEKKQNSSKETLNDGIVNIKDALTPQHVEEIKNALKSKDVQFPILYIQDLKNGKDFELIRGLHDYLEENDLNIGCIISGENHFSAILLLSSEHIKYRSAAIDTVFVYDMEDYIKTNSESDDTYFAENLNSYFGAGNPFNADTITAVYDEGDEFCVYKAYVFGIIDNIMIFKSEDLEDEKCRNDVIDDVIFDTELYIDRMDNIKDYLFGSILKLY